MARHDAATAARRRPFRPRRWALLLLLTALLAVAYHLFLPAGAFPLRERRVVHIQRGQSVRQIGAELKRVGLIQGTLGFELLARGLRLDRRIKAGQYAFRLGTTVPALLRALARGMSGLNLITIPEGLTVAEASRLLAAHLGVPDSAFIALSRDRPFLDSLNISAPTIEGYLAPDTYEFLPGTAPEVAFRTMARRTQRILLEATAGLDSLPLGMSLHQMLTLASIVEAEARFEDERRHIARVYLNRLDRDMRLQADPTVAFAMGKPPRTRLYLKDLLVQNAYNTYQHSGLPPGPICSPGRASIEAVIAATPGVQDLYFVARGEGRHLFARSYEEHLKNIIAARAMIAARAESLSTDSTAATLADSAGMSLR